MLENAIRLDTAGPDRTRSKSVLHVTGTRPDFQKRCHLLYLQNAVGTLHLRDAFRYLYVGDDIRDCYLLFHGLITGDTSQFRFRPPFNVKAHLFTLVGLTLLWRAWNYKFVMYDLLYASNDVVRGGGGYASDTSTPTGFECYALAHNLMRTDFYYQYLLETQRLCFRWIRRLPNRRFPRTSLSRSPYRVGGLNRISRS